MSNWSVLTGTAVVPYAVLGVLPILLALWCALATEVWHLKQNCLEHRVGIRGWSYSHMYRNATLEIVLRYSTNFNIPDFRL